jgi:uncharacterized membrane protein
MTRQRTPPTDDKEGKLVRLHPWHRQATHPAVRHWHDTEWASSAQNRVADWITRFSGSMGFVYLHIVWFALWLLAHWDINLLTMIVSLEAIFLATFVLISQNRADAKRQVIADAQYKHIQEIHAAICEAKGQQ